MAIARKVPLIIQNDWTMDYVNHLGTEIAGKKAGIVGLGNIGSRIGELAKGIGMDVTYWSRKTRDDRFTYVELDKLFAESDVVFITCLLYTSNAKALSVSLTRLTGSNFDNFPKAMPTIKLPRGDFARENAFWESEVFMCILYLSLIHI